MDVIQKLITINT
ncbi:hypothetical protein FWK35_00038626 [Aphis craccivora]|uniref:Uncharacterized protein n=1 Tax=Aphis craccivora TaxID=307492 RepID=A0A6G0YSZ8_APHCR|nr:hypothetical protein FWK35_00038626 [Aphis craccivora]